MANEDVVAVINELMLSSRSSQYSGTYEQGYLHALDDLLEAFGVCCCSKEVDSGSEACALVV